MSYIAWSDGSLTNKRKAFVSFLIINSKNNQVISQYKARVTDLNTSIDAEYMALCLLLRKIKELNIKDIDIFSDCKTVVDNILFKNKIKTLHIPFRKIILQKIGVDFFQQIKDHIHWEKRKHNIAHKIFKTVKLCDCIHSSQDWLLKKQKIPDFISCSNILDSLIPIPGSILKIKEKALMKYQKSIRSTNDSESLKSLLKKLHKSLSFAEKDQTIFVTGKLHIYVANNIIQDIEIKESEWTTLYRKIKLKKEKPIPLTKSLRKKPLEPCHPIPNTNLSIEESLLLKFHTTTKDLKARSEEKTLLLLSEKINNATKFLEGDLEVYVYGKLHLFVLDNVIRDFKICYSEYTDKHRNQLKAI